MPEFFSPEEALVFDVQNLLRIRGAVLLSPEQIDMVMVEGKTRLSDAERRGRIAGLREAARTLQLAAVNADLNELSDQLRRRADTLESQA